jgi:hypothetical protein
MRFEMSHTIHFGYAREKGVIYDDLTAEDVANLSAPRPGMPKGYGRVLPEETNESTTPAETGSPAAEPPASGTGSDDAPGGSPNTDPKAPAQFSCPACGKSFADRPDPEVSLAAHRRQTKH